MHRILSRFSMILIPSGTIGYYYETNYQKIITKTNILTDEDELSDFAKNYIQKNKLVVPEHYIQFVRNNKLESFFHHGILSKMEGMNSFNVFFDEEYLDILYGKKETSAKEIENIKNHARIHCVFNPNNRVQGHYGILHGGCTATLYDSVASILAYAVNDFSPIATAYLNITYKQPIKTGNDYVLIWKVKKKEGRKTFLEGKIVDKNDNLYSKADALFVKVDWGSQFYKKKNKENVAEGESATVAESST